MPWYMRQLSELVSIYWKPFSVKSLGFDGKTSSTARTSRDMITLTDVSLTESVRLLVVYDWRQFYPLFIVAEIRNRWNLTPRLVYTVPERNLQRSEFSYFSYTVCPPKSDPLNVWLWQVQTCTALHIIKRAQALMYFDYCHQILYKSVIPFSRFSIFSKRCQKMQLPAALLACFQCAVTVFYVNVQHFSFNAVCWYFISWTCWFLLIQLWR